MDVLKDLGLAAPVKLMVRAGMKGKEIKKRGKPELGDLVNESVPPAVAMGGTCVLDLPPQPLAGFFSRCTDQTKPVLQLFTKQRFASLVSLFLPFLLSPCFTWVFFLFPVTSQFLQFDFIIMLAKQSPLKVSSHG